MAGRVTEALRELRRDDPTATERLVRLVYDDLRRLAAAHMRGQPRGHTLQPTALAHEAYLRLMGRGRGAWNDRRHFLRSAACAMRAVLVDLARERGAAKRGGGRMRITFDESVHGAPESSCDVLAIHDALARLASVDPQMSQVVELRFFGGLTAEEAADVMGVSLRTVFVLWDHARAWLYREIAP
jgi:RNA polymerase sigma factor (TIGR02999 family)